MAFEAVIRDSVDMRALEEACNLYFSTEVSNYINDSRHMPVQLQSVVRQLRETLEMTELVETTFARVVAEQLNLRLTNFIFSERGSDVNELQIIVGLLLQSIRELRKIVVGDDEIEDEVILSKMVDDLIVHIRGLQLFEIIRSGKDSSHLWSDLKHRITRRDQRDFIVQTFLKTCEDKLLQPGPETAEIINFYASTMKVFLKIDPDGVLLDKVARPIRLYLRSRDDFVHVLMQGILGSERNELLADDFAAIVDTSGQDEDEDEYDDLNWTPDPIDVDPSYRKQRNHDTVGSLINIHENKDVFIKELQTILAERLLSREDYEVRNEERELNALRHRFGESNLHMCEIMIQDIHQSRLLQREVARVQPNAELKLRPKILSRLFWPPFRAQDLKLPSALQEILNYYTTQYKTFKHSRSLEWYPNLGLLNITIELLDRKLHLDVTPLQATVLYHFDEQPIWSLFPLATKLDVDEASTRRTLLFWTSQGVIQETANEEYKLLEREDESSHPIVLAPEVDSIVQSAEDKSAEEMRVYWSFIEGMLTNLGTLPLDRIHSMLTMFVPAPNSYTRSMDELRDFMSVMISEGNIELVGGGMYKLKTSS